MDKSFNEIVQHIFTQQRELYSSKFNNISLSLKSLIDFNPCFAEKIIEDIENLKVIENQLSEEGIFENPRIKLIDIPEILKVKIRDLRTHHVGKLIFVKGKIVTISTRGLEVESITYECPNCGTLASIDQLGEKVREPDFCFICKFRTSRIRGFNILRKSMIDAQDIEVRDLQQKEEFGLFQPVRVILKEDLCDTEFDPLIRDGREIEIIGTAREIPRHIKKGDSVYLELVIVANNIFPSMISK